MSAVGAPPFLCFGKLILYDYYYYCLKTLFLEYPWTSIDITGWAQLKRWLYLPDYVNPHTATQLIGKIN